MNIGRENIGRLGLVTLMFVAWGVQVTAASDLKVYIVLLRRDFESSLPVANLSSAHDALLEQALIGAYYSKIYSYTHVLNGFAVYTSTEQAQTLREISEVLSIEEDAHVYASTTHTPDYLGLPTGAWAQVKGGPKKAGEGVVVGIIDTGVYPLHPSFSSEASSPAAVSRYRGTCDVTKYFPAGSCNKKLVGAQHFLDGLSKIGNQNASDPDWFDPLDRNGHGTHTSSTAGGKYGVPVVYHGVNYGSASGMAPGAGIAMYKALDKSGSGVQSDIVAAIDKAAKDGVNILNLSLGPSGPPFNNSTYLADAVGVALLGAVKSGIFVTQAAGNNGPSTSSLISWSPWIVSVAASSTDRTYPNNIVLGSKQTVSGGGFAPPTPGSDLHKLVLSTDAHLEHQKNDTFNFDCADPTIFDPSIVAGSILVCIDDGATSSGSTINATLTTGRTVKAAGAVLVLNYNQFNLPFLPTLVGDYPVSIIYKPEEITTFFQYYNKSTVRDSHSGKVTQFGGLARLTGGQKAAFSGSAPVVAYFSSRGPDINSGAYDPADFLKPSVLAPGVDIWAGWTPTGNPYEVDALGELFAIISGTSMATPHVTGIAALVKEVHPKWSPAAIASAILTTASSTNKQGNALSAQDLDSEYNLFIRPGTPFDFGAGFVNATAALDPGLVFDAGFDDYLKFLCSIPNVPASLIAAATGGKCGSLIGLPSNLNSPSITIATLNGSRIVPRTVTNVGQYQEKYTMVITEPTGVSISVRPHFFVIARGGALPLQVTLTTTVDSNQTTFGSLVLHGSLGHIIQIPITVSLKNKLH